MKGKKCSKMRRGVCDSLLPLFVVFFFSPVVPSAHQHQLVSDSSLPPVEQDGHKRPVLVLHAAPRAERRRLVAEEVRDDRRVGLENLRFETPLFRFAETTTQTPEIDPTTRSGNATPSS